MFVATVNSSTDDSSDEDDREEVFLIVGVLAE